MRTFEEFRQYLKEAVEPFYIAWGFINPSGEVIEKSGPEQNIDGCHAKLAFKLGLGSLFDALRKDWIRWGVDKQKTMFFNGRLSVADPYVKHAMITLAEKYAKHWDNIATEDTASHKGAFLHSVEEFKKTLIR
jgi:hypothetical protein